MADDRGPIAPMLATAGPVPPGPGWAFEVKFDGVRAVAQLRRGRLRLVSRNDRDISAGYPEVTDLDLGGGDLGDGLVLDGELVAYDERGRPDFELLQHRMHVAHPSAELRARVPVSYVVFDLLRHGDGSSLLTLPYRQRRAALTALDLPARGLPVPPNFVDVAGATVLAAVGQQGLEGIVAKRLDSAYHPGRRSRSWIKTPIRHTAEVIVLGWTPSTGNRNALSSLLLGAHDGGGVLVHVGDVGTGFTDAARARLLDRLRPLRRGDPPVAGEVLRAGGWPGRRAAGATVHWVEPELVGEIEYRAFTRDGRFRHPSWRGLRPDRDPGEVGLPPS